MELKKASLNRLANAGNPYQGDYKKVLCLCSAGLLRSPTAAVVLSQEPYNFNTRAAGMSSDFALIVFDEALLQWADEIVCMDYAQYNALELMRLNENTKGLIGDIPVINLNISDSYPYRDPELMVLISNAYDKAFEPAETKESTWEAELNS